MDFVPKCLATGIGSLPFTEAGQACELVLQTLSSIPFWPQLPKRSAKENMYWQYSEHLPGVAFEQERMFIHSECDFSEIEKFYEHFLSEETEYFAISREYAAGLYKFLTYKEELSRAWALKGQITGPVSFALQVTDENRRSLIYHEELNDIVTKNLLRIANWQERKLREYNQRIIIFLDEPYLSAYGSAFTNVGREQVTKSLEEVLQGIQSFTGIHCCGNTDWSLLLDSSVNILSFDAYNYASNLLLYEQQLKSYLDRGGTIAWGIVPTDEEILAEISVDILVQKLENIWADFLKLGIDRQQLLFASLITPSCGLGTVAKDMAEKALTLTRGLSYRIQEKYHL